VRQPRDRAAYARNTRAQPARLCAGSRTDVGVFLAGASERMRGHLGPGRPGRPRKHPLPLDTGHVAGTLSSPTRINSGVASRTEVRKAPAPKVAPRLLSLRQAADYLGLSTWTVRALIDSGSLPRVPLPVRKILLDREALDRLIELPPHLAPPQ
jgi:excisionase family DNA binding protein